MSKLSENNIITYDSIYCALSFIVYSSPFSPRFLQNPEISHHAIPLTVSSTPSSQESLHVAAAGKYMSAPFLFFPTIWTTLAVLWTVIDLTRVNNKLGFKLKFKYLKL